jgi:hypothetical protein
MSQESPVARVTTIDHLYLAVRALERSEPFYDGVMRLLDFRKKASTIAGVRARSSPPLLPRRHAP